MFNIFCIAVQCSAGSQLVLVHTQILLSFSNLLHKNIIRSKLAIFSQYFALYSHLVTQQLHHERTTALRKSNGSSNVVDAPSDVYRVVFLPECCYLIGQITASAVFLYVRGKCHKLEYHQKFTKKN